MSKAASYFDNSIKDAEELLAYYHEAGHPPPPKAEVLKRAGLVMALTAWETYVEDRVIEEVECRWAPDDGNEAGRLLKGKLEQELKTFNTPSAGNTRRLFQDYVGIDVTKGWTVQGNEPVTNEGRLTELIKKRGQAVHRAKSADEGGPSSPHLVTRKNSKSTSGS